MRLKRANKHNIVLNLTLKQLKNNEIFGNIIEIFDYLYDTRNYPIELCYESTISKQVN